MCPTIHELDLALPYLTHQIRLSNAVNLRRELDEANARIDAQSKRFLSEKERMGSTINDLRTEMVEARITSRREATRGEKLDREIALTRQILRDQEERAKAAADRANVLESEIHSVRSDALASKAAAAEVGLDIEMTCQKSTLGIGLHPVLIAKPSLSDP